MRLRARSGRGLGLALVALLAGSCVNVPSPKVWNLREVHYPDGRPKYVGDVRWDLEHLLVGAFESTSLGSPEFVGEQQDAVKDPHKVCLKNLNRLAKCKRSNPKTRAVMVEMYSWLAGDCKYGLSRERCAIELGDLGLLAGVKAPLVLGENAEPASSEIVGEELKLLFEEASPLISGEDSPSQRELLAARCKTIDNLTLDRDGARRLLRVTNILLSRWRVERRESVEPLLRLHLDLEKKCIALALGTMFEDENPRARAAALWAGIKITRNEKPEYIVRAFQDPSPEVQVVAMRALTKFGAPKPPKSGNPGLLFQNERFWTEQVVEVLRLGTGGEIAVAGCKAMSRLTGEPRDLHPETWIVWWEDQGSPAMGGRGSPRGSR